MNAPDRNPQQSLVHYLGDVLMEARKEAGISRERLAATDPNGVAGGTLYRFEMKRNADWPRDPELFVRLYADAIGVSPALLWLEAVTRYAGAQGVGRPARREKPLARADVQRALARARQAAQALHLPQAPPRTRRGQG